MRSRHPRPSHGRRRGRFSCSSTGYPCSDRPGPSCSRRPAIPDGSGCPSRRPSRSAGVDGPQGHRELTPMTTDRAVILRAVGEAERSPSAQASGPSIEEITVFSGEAADVAAGHGAELDTESPVGFHIRNAARQALALMRRKTAAIQGAPKNRVSRSSTDRDSCAPAGQACRTQRRLPRFSMASSPSLRISSVPCNSPNPWDPPMASDRPRENWPRGRRTRCTRASDRPRQFRDADGGHRDACPARRQ